MNVMIIATKQCSHSPNLLRELDEIGINHRVVYVEDEPELIKELSIRHSPNLVVDKVVVFRRQPSEQELRDYFIQVLSN